MAAGKNFMNGSEALHMAKIFSLDREMPAILMDFENPLTRKLCELLLSRLKGERMHGKDVFTEYLGDMDYEKLRPNYCSSLAVSENSYCNGMGWSGMRITGPSELAELNRAECFTYECTNFALSYMLLCALERNGENIMEYLTLSGEEIYERAGDLYYEADIQEWLDYELFMDTEEGFEVEVDIVEYLMLGAYYIHCTLSKKKMEKKHKVRFCALGEKYSGYAGAVKYYDSFISRLRREQGFSYDAGSFLLPYLLDVFFSLKDISYQSGGGTPCLYAFTSKSMKEYKDIREKCLSHPYIEVMDKLLTYLEDPLRIRQTMDVADAVELTGSMNMTEVHHLSACYGYVGDEYVACYYHFYHDNDTFFLHPYFVYARECFDVLLTELKAGSVANGDAA